MKQSITFLVQYDEKGKGNISTRCSTLQDASAHAKKARDRGVDKILIKPQTLQHGATQGKDVKWWSNYRAYTTTETNEHNELVYGSDEWSRALTLSLR